MEKIHISPLEMDVSRICLGTWAIGGWMWGGSDETESIETIRYALENGINIIDTAPVYGFGIAEEILGKALKQHGQRDKTVIATKAGLEWQDGKIHRNASPAHIRKEIEDSLKRLQTDYIDIYQIHWPDPLVPIPETAKTLLDLFEEGKIRAIGVSNFSVEQMEVFRQTAPIHTSQPPYNLFEREIEKTVLAYTEKNNIVTLAYGALCRGFLTGKIRPYTLFPNDDIRKFDPKFKAPYFEQYLDTVSALIQYSQHEFGKSVLALAVRWILDRGHTVALWGARHPEQLHPMKEVMGWNLDKEAMHRIDTILAANIKDPVGPEFMAPV